MTGRRVAWYRAAAWTGRGNKRLVIGFVEVVDQELDKVRLIIRKKDSPTIEWLDQY